MTDPVQLATLRQVLARVFPMQGVIVVGVGRGQGLADFRSASSLLLIDARAEAIEALQKQSSDEPYCTAVQAVIASQTGSTAFHLANKPDESGLIAPEALQPLWRNLTTRKTEQLEALTLPDLVARVELGVDSQANWLVVDCLPALPVLQGAGNLIDDVEVLELRCVRDEAIAVEQGASLASIKQWLEQLGFRLVQQAEESHPQLVKAVFCRDPRKVGAALAVLQEVIAELRTRSDENVSVHAKETAALTAERDTLTQTIAAADKLAAARQAQLDALATERKQLIAVRDALMLEKVALTAERDGLANERQALSAERDIFAQAKAAADKLAAARQAQVEVLLAERAVLADLDTRFKHQAEGLAQLRKFTETSVKKTVSNATKQLEATLGLQSYFVTGELLDICTENQNWPISPDFAHYLVELIELNDYDLIIEFGSGYSTALIAKALARRASKRTGRAVGFVSFEHLDDYYQQTLDRLRSARLSSTVQLMLAPLEEWQGADGEAQLYYACQQTFSLLVQQYPLEGLRSLIVVDGPPAGTGPQARYPAGPIVLKHFAGAQIDFLLDDYIRDDEKKVAQRWQAEITATGFAHTTTLRKFEKDACLIRVHPRSLIECK